MTARDIVQTDLTPLYDEVADFFASSPSAQEITQFRLSQDSEQLVSDWLDVNRNRGLTNDERTALDEYTRIERLVQAIKIRAFGKFAEGSSHTANQKKLIFSPFL
jgi:hypothetical protein